MNGIELIVLITARGKGDGIVRLAAAEGIAFRVMLRGRGTAGSETLRIRGIGDSEKDVVLLSVETARAKDVMDRIAEKANLDRPGDGIAFMLPFSAAASQFMTYELFRGVPAPQEEKKGLFSKRQKKGDEK